MEPVTLVVLAAGSSTRFGRPKQLEPVGPRGETILDITLSDAFAAGCDEARLVVRAEHHHLFSTRYENDQRVGLCIQEAPLGTAHAALIGMQRIAGSYIVANGDDHYGARSLQVAVEHIGHAPPTQHALVAFALEDTLSASGPVNRAVCESTGSFLAGTTEAIGLARAADGTIRDAGGTKWPSDTLVSMNLWVFRSDLFKDPGLHAQPTSSPTEFGLPELVHHALRKGHAFRILRTPDRWCGLTYAGDAELVRSILAGRG